MTKTLKPSQVEIRAIKPMRVGSLLSYVDIRIAGSIEIRKCRWIQQPGMRPYLSPPQEVWEDEGGKRRYNALVVWPSEWREAIQQRVLEAWEDHPEGIGLIGLAGTEFGTELRAKAGIGGGQ